jgi:hypothetical protein
MKMNTMKQMPSVDIGGLPRDHNSGASQLIQSLCLTPKTRWSSGQFLTQKRSPAVTMPYQTKLTPITSKARIEIFLFILAFTVMF